MSKMFANCSSLTSLTLSSFSTERATKMESMFSGCQKLSEIDLSTFDTFSVNDIQEMFINCKNLQYINFKEYNEQVSTLVLNNILDYVPDNIVIYINNNNNIDKLLEIIN